MAESEDPAIADNTDQNVDYDEDDSLSDKLKGWF